jgi:hypothetical protein
VHRIKEEPEDEEEEEDEQVIKKNNNTAVSRSDRLANRSGVKTEDVVKTSASPVAKITSSKQVKDEKPSASRTSTRKVQF